MVYLAYHFSGRRELKSYIYTYVYRSNNFSSLANQKLIVFRSQSSSLTLKTQVTWLLAASSPQHRLSTEIGHSQTRKSGHCPPLYCSDANSDTWYAISPPLSLLLRHYSRHRTPSRRYWETNTTPPERMTISFTRTSPQRCLVAF